MSIKLKLVPMGETSSAKAARKARRREIQRKLEAKSHSKVCKILARYLEAAENDLYELDK